MNLLVDVTGFEARNQVPAQWLLRIAALLSPTTLQSFQNIIIFNPSTTFKAYARTILRRVSFDNFESRRIIAVSGTAELNRHLSSSLLSSSSRQFFAKSVSFATDMLLLVNISREKRTVFRNVTQLSEWKVEYPVQIEVGTATILVTTVSHSLVVDALPHTDMECFRPKSIKYFRTLTESFTMFCGCPTLSTLPGSRSDSRDKVSVSSTREKHRLVASWFRIGEMNCSR